jgi:hypothetical protein
LASLGDKLDQRKHCLVGFSLASLNCRNQHCNSSGGQVPPDDHTKLICTVASWVYPLAANRSFFVCARKLAQKYTALRADQVTGPHSTRPFSPGIFSRKWSSPHRRKMTSSATQCACIYRTNFRDLEFMNGKHQSFLEERGAETSKHIAQRARTEVLAVRGEQPRRRR